MMHCVDVSLSFFFALVETLRRVSMLAIRAWRVSISDIGLTNRHVRHLSYSRSSSKPALFKYDQNTRHCVFEST